MQVVDIQTARDRREEAKLTSHRQWLLDFARTTDFPLDRVPDPETGVERLTPEGRDEMQRILDVFGVTKLDPDDADHDKVVQTWVELRAIAGVFVTRERFGKEIHDLRQGFSSPAYRSYLEALWAGERQAIEQAAQTLGIESGIAVGSPFVFSR